MWFWLIGVTSAILIYMLIWKPRKYWEERNVPHLKPYPIIGSMIEPFTQQGSLADTMVKYCNMFKDNRYFGIHQFLMPVLFLKDVDLIKQITIKDFDYFTDHLAFASEKVDPLFANSLVLLKGQKWRNMRSTLSPAFTSSKMKLMHHLIVESAEQFVDYFLKTADPEKGVILELKDTFTRFANDVIATTAFGVQCNSLSDPNNEFYIMGKRSTDFAGLNGFKMFGYTIMPKVMEFFNIKLLKDDINDFFRHLVLSTMSIREEKGIVRPDMIHLLMQARKGTLKYEESVKKKEDDVGFAIVEESQIGKEEKNKFLDWNDDDITAQVAIFLFAGFDTSSTLFCHMANELAVNPDIQKKLQEEIDNTLTECKNGKITYEAIAKMKYLDMIVCETLRKWPPSAVTTRLCTRSYTLQPVLSTEKPVIIDKDTVIYIPIYAIHHNPEYFSKPEKFDPERFSEENKEKIKSMTYIPFGLGPRNCIGSRFAILEAKILFVQLLSKFDIKTNEKTQIPLKLSKNNFNMTAENGFWLTLKPREEKKNV